MIPKMSSQELNKIFKDAQVNNVLFEKKLEAIKDDMGKKINIIKYENAFINKKLDVIDTGLIANDSLVSFNKNSYGMFNEYGYMIHPKFKKTPIDLMNLKLPEGGNYFKEGIITKVNGVEMPSYTNILMADNHITKGITFDEYNTENISLEFSLSNELLLGVMRFNTIEIDPYIYGAYDLLSIDIYTLDSTNNITAEPTIVLNGFDNIARTRIILKEKVKFTKVVFNFKVNYKTEKNFVDIFPFGLKHIHFYEADYVEDSFVITQFVSDKFIEYVMNNMTLYTTQGKLDIDAMDYGIEVYTDYENNTLMGKVNLSTEASIYRIPKNTKTIYIKIPLLQKNIKTKEKTYLCLNGVGLNFTTNQEIVL